MKLRNKKTGKVFDLECITVFERPGESLIDDSIDEFYSIAELNEEWEDYTPAVPLIKDEKIRKAVRAWANANNDTKLKVSSGCIMTTFRGLHSQYEIELRFCGFEDGDYTIAELCGEEE